MTAAASRNIKLVSQSDQGGRSDGVQVIVYRGYAYIGQTFSNGFTILDVRDARHPKFVDFIACPPNTRRRRLSRTSGRAGRPAASPPGFARSTSPAATGRARSDSSRSTASDLTGS